MILQMVHVRNHPSGNGFFRAGQTVHVPAEVSATLAAQWIAAGHAVQIADPPTINSIRLLNNLSGPLLSRGFSAGDVAQVPSDIDQSTAQLMVDSGYAKVLT